MTKSCILFVYLICGLLLTGAHAFTATIENGRGICDIKLKGEIVKGDAELLRLLIDEKGDINKDERVTLCLDSPGGDYPEGLKIIEVLLRGDSSGVTTRLQKDASCDSACALVFMAGAYGSTGDELPRVASRFLDLQAISLGFHRPYFDVEDGTYDSKALEISAIAATKSIVQLMKQNEDNQFPNSLLVEVLDTGREKLFEIDTLDKLGRWDIGLTGFQFNREVTEAMANQACVNESVWRLEKPSNTISRRSNASMTKRIGGLIFYRFDSFGSEGTEFCTVATRKTPRPGFHISFEESPLDQGEPINANVAAQIFEVMDMDQEYVDGIWMVLPPETTLASLRARSTNAAEPTILESDKDKPKRADSGQVPRFRLLINRDLDGVLVRKEKAISIEACQKFCSADGECKYFTFNSWNRICFLKKEATTTYLEPSSHSGILASEPELQRSSSETIMARFRGKSFPGPAYSKKLAKDEVACQQLCISEDKCLVYTFDKTGRNCRLFSKANEYISDTSSDSGVKRQR